MKKVLIGLDVGTQGTKGIAYEEEGSKIIARACCSYGLLENEEKISGRAEQDPSVWVDAVRMVVSELGKALKTEYEYEYEIVGIGVSGQQHGMVALDEDHGVIRPAKLWCDVEAAKEATELSEKFHLHNHLSAGFTAPKVLWMRRNEPSHFDKVKTIVLPHDYINMVLQCDDYYTSSSSSSSLQQPTTHVTTTTTTNSTKQAQLVRLCDVTPQTDPGDASGTGYWDPPTRQYNRHMLEYIGLSKQDAVPTVLDSPNAVCGYLSHYWKQLLLNNNNNYNYNIPISAGSGDNMCSALGCGCVEEGTAVLSLGTSATLFGKSRLPIIQQTTMVAPFADATGHYLPLVCTMNCTGVLQSILEAYFPPNTTHAQASQIILRDEQVPPGSHGLLFLPFLNGERTPNWPHSTGALLNITPHNIQYAATPAVIYHAAMEGIAYSLNHALLQIKQATSTSSSSSFDPNSFLLVGGGSKNTLWTQIIANVLQKQLILPMESETAALGAAFQAGAASSQTDISEYIQKQTIITILHTTQTTQSAAVVQPTDNIHIQNVYQKGFQLYLDMSQRMFASTMTS